MKVLRAASGYLFGNPVLSRKIILLLSLIISGALSKITLAGAGNIQRDAGYYYDSAKSYLDMKQYPEAIKLYKAAAEISPNEIRGYIGLAWAYWAMKNYPEAINSLEEAIRANPDNEQGYINLGRVYLYMDNYPEAIKWFKEAIRVNPRESSSYSGIGWVCLKQSNYSGALSWFEEAIKRNTRDRDGYTGLGWVYSSSFYGQKNYHEAIRWFKEGIKVDPGYVKNYYGIGRAYYYQKDYKEAIKWYQEAVKINPNAIRGYEGLGDTYLDMGKYEEGIRWFNKGIRESLNYSYGCSYQGLGKVYKKIGKPRLAEESFLNAIKEEPYRYKGYYNMAEYYFELGKLDKAEENIEKALTCAMSDIDKRQVLELKGFILIMKNDYASAEGLFDDLRKRYGTSSLTLSGLGHIYNARKDYKRARRYFVEAIETKGDDWVIASLGLGWVNANEHKHREAIVCYQRVLRENPLNILGLLGMGNAYNWLKEYDKAEWYFKRALGIDPDNEYALAELGTVYLNKGQTKEARELFGRSLQINKTTYSCPYEGLGLMYLSQNRLQEAEKNFMKAIEINPQIEYKKYNGLAKIYIRQSRYQEARRLLRRSIENYPYDSEARELLRAIEVKTDKK